MGCGCKNKSQGAQTPQTQSNPNVNTSNVQQTKSSSIQENIKKVVEKYYNKK